MEAVKRVTAVAVAVKKLEIVETVNHALKCPMSFQVPDLSVPTFTLLKMSVLQLRPTCLLNGDNSLIMISL